MPRHFRNRLPSDGSRHGGDGQIGSAPERGEVLVAEADGNRTSERRGTPLTGFETGFGCDDCPVCVLSAVVRPGHPGSSGTSGDGTGSHVHGTGVHPVPISADARTRPLQCIDRPRSGEVGAGRIVEAEHSWSGQPPNPCTVWNPETGNSNSSPIVAYVQAFDASVITLAVAPGLRRQGPAPACHGGLAGSSLHCHPDRKSVV